MKPVIDYQHDLLSGRDAAELLDIDYSHLRVLVAREQFPTPVRVEPQLWLREDVEQWRASRRA